VNEMIRYTYEEFAKLIIVMQSVQQFLHRSNISLDELNEFQSIIYPSLHDIVYIINTNKLSRNLIDIYSDEKMENLTIEDDIDLMLRILKTKNNIK